MLAGVFRAFVRIRTNSIKVGKRKNDTRHFSAPDEKFIKLSKKEEQESAGEDEFYVKRNPNEPKRTHDKGLERKIYLENAQEFKRRLSKTDVNLPARPLQTYHMLQEAMEGYRERGAALDREQYAREKARFDGLDIREWNGRPWKEIKRAQPHFNCERMVNEKFRVERREGVDPVASRRCGLIAYKVGMVSFFDKWGQLVPLTVLQVDRCQVLRLRTVERDGYSALVVGAGDKSLNRVTKPAVGQFLKAGVPPKRDVCEFKVDPANALPPGFMLGARHFTVGQCVDIQSRSKGKGTQGVMERWGFKGLPASHGCSLKHRSGGAIGARQDPGRVWKRKKMSGRGGFQPVTVRRMLVYRTDYERSLIYLKGSVPGLAGRAVKVYDSFFHARDNRNLLNFPSFVYEAGRDYANILQVEPAADDPAEAWEHENAVLPDEEEEAMQTLEEGAGAA